MMSDRLLRVGIELDGVMNYYDQLGIKCSGSKTNNSTQNEFNISITNLNRETRDYILTNNNILNRRLRNKRITIEAGRVDTGLSLVYSGDIRMVNTTQPPNITLNVKTYTGDAEKQNLVSVSSGAATNLSQICQTIANGLGKTLLFQATDKKISNYTFTGSNLEQVRKIEDLGGIDITVDDNSLIVKNENVPLNGQTRLVNARTGMVGKPIVNERGISVKILFDNTVRIGTLMRVESDLNRALNGDYVIYEMRYDLANRDIPFYITLNGTRLENG